MSIDSFFPEFDFCADFIEVYQETVPPKSVLFSRDGYFAAPMPYFLEANIDRRHLFKKTLLKNNDIVFGALPDHDDCPSDGLNRFLKKLFWQEIIWVKKYLDALYNYLCSKKSNNQALINESAIKIKIGKVVSLLEQLQYSTENLSNGSNHLHIQLIESIFYVCETIGELFGGVGYLESGVYNMQMTFMHINSIYIIDDNSHE